MRPSKSVEEICKDFNSIRINKQGEELTREQVLVDMLFVFSKSHGSCAKFLPMLEKVGVLKVRKDKLTKFYSYPKNPIHIDLFRKILNDFRKSMRMAKKFELTEESCIEFLKSHGYIISKPSTLNMEKVKEMLGDKLLNCYNYEVC